MLVEPNNSTLKKIEARGALTQAQNMAVSPKAAATPGSKPNSVPAKHPKVEPIKKTGTISPPLKPAPKVNAVKIIFKRNASGEASPWIARAITSIPAPL